MVERQGFPAFYLITRMVSIDSRKSKGVQDLHELLYFLSFVSISWLLYRGFRILLVAQPLFAKAASLHLGLAFIYRNDDKIHQHHYASQANPFGQLLDIK